MIRPRTTGGSVAMMGTPGDASYNNLMAPRVPQVAAQSDEVAQNRNLMSEYMDTNQRLLAEDAPNRAQMRQLQIGQMQANLARSAPVRGRAGAEYRRMQQQAKEQAQAEAEKKSPTDNLSPKTPGLDAYAKMNEGRNGMVRPGSVGEQTVAKGGGLTPGGASEGSPLVKPQADAAIDSFTPAGGGRSSDDLTQSARAAKDAPIRRAVGEIATSPYSRGGASVTTADGRVISSGTEPEKLDKEVAGKLGWKQGAGFPNDEARQAYGEQMAANKAATSKPQDFASRLDAAATSAAAKQKTAFADFTPPPSDESETPPAPAPASPPSTDASARVADAPATPPVPPPSYPSQSPNSWNNVNARQAAAEVDRGKQEGHPIADALGGAVDAVSGTVRNVAGAVASPFVRGAQFLGDTRAQKDFGDSIGNAIKANVSDPVQKLMTGASPMAKPSSPIVADTESDEALQKKKAGVLVPPKSQPKSNNQSATGTGSSLLTNS